MDRARATALCLSLFAIVFSLACDRGDSAERERTGRGMPAVEAVPARHGALPITQRLSGVVSARNQIAVHPEIDAVVSEVLVRDGEMVERGQPLVRLRAREYEERLKQSRASLAIAEAELRRARAQAREARADLDRAHALAAEQLASRADLETAEARSESAEADVALAAARVEQAQAVIEERSAGLTQTVIRAPVAGTVGDRHAEVGMLAGRGTRLFTLGQLDSVRVEVVLTDRMLASIGAGQRAEIAAADTVLVGRVSRISPFLNPVTHSTQAEIDLANPDRTLKPGMFVQVDIHSGESERATLIPISALYENPGTGAVGVFASHDPSLGEDEVPAGDRTGEAPPAGPAGTGRLAPQAADGKRSDLMGPVTFEFVAVDLVAEGRLQAGIRGIDPGTWVVTVGQNLLGEQGGEARVRRSSWERVERLQRLQREDLIRELVP
jgi:RND family efflux transporter MFP subunit